MVAEVDARPIASARRGTVAQLCGEWLDYATPSFSPIAVETTRTYIEEPIIPLIGSNQVTKLSPADLDRCYRQLLEVGRSRGPYATATIRRVHGIIRRALAQGVRWGWITHNPAIDASPPKVPMKELRPPDPGQFVRVFNVVREADPDLATFVMLAASSGARRGELLALRWRDIDLDGGRLHAWHLNRANDLDVRNVLYCLKPPFPSDGGFAAASAGRRGRICHGYSLWPAQVHRRCTSQKCAYERARFVSIPDTL